MIPMYKLPRPVMLSDYTADEDSCHPTSSARPPGRVCGFIVRTSKDLAASRHLDARSEIMLFQYKPPP